MLEKQPANAIIAPEARKIEMLLRLVEGASGVPRYQGFRA